MDQYIFPTNPSFLCASAPQREIICFYIHRPLSIETQAEQGLTPPGGPTEVLNKPSVKLQLWAMNDIHSGKFYYDNMERFYRDRINLIGHSFRD